MLNNVNSLIFKEVFSDLVFIFFKFLIKKTNFCTTRYYAMQVSFI